MNVTIFVWLLAASMMASLQGATIKNKTLCDVLLEKFDADSAEEYEKGLGTQQICLHFGRSIEIEGIGFVSVINICCEVEPIQITGLTDSSVVTLTYDEDGAVTYWVEEAQ